MSKYDLNGLSDLDYIQDLRSNLDYLPFALRCSLSISAKQRSLGIIECPGIGQRTVKFIQICN